MNAVKLSGVSFSYDGKNNILKNAGFSAKSGEITLVAGHSGEGKSTLLSIISGIIPNINGGFLSGKVHINGEDILSLKLGDICRKVGVVLQNADEQIVHRYVGDEIAFGCENLAFAPQKIESQINIVCELMGINPDWKTRTLSGGQKQRLITASVLAMGQRVIILDEPLANLDLEGAAKLMQTLKMLARSGYCVIVVEHRLDIILPYADAVWHICAGRLSEIEDKYAYLKQQSVAIKDTCLPCTGNEPLLELNNTAFGVKSAEVIKDITCRIRKGSRTVLLGENGSGKTTLIRLIARLYKPTGGSIIQHIDKKLSQKYRANKAWFKKVGVVYQNPDYQLFMPTVEKEIAFKAVSPGYAKEIIQIFNLTELVSRHPHSLSEGQKRRVSIAAVAAGKPELLLLDEPTVGQDYEGLCALTGILNELHETTGNTIITVTHDMRCAAALCDDALLIDGGKIKEQGGKELVEKYFAVKKNSFKKP